MERLYGADVKVGERYEQVRDEQRRSLGERQRQCRIALSGGLALVFESRATVQASLEETLRTEHTTDADRVDAAVGVFNAAIPRAGGLFATLYIEVTDAAELTRAMADLEGIHETLQLEIGDEWVSAVTDPAAGGEPAAAWQVLFLLEEQHRVAWRHGAEVAVVVEHPAAPGRTVLSEEQRRAVGAEL